MKSEELTKIQARYNKLKAKKSPFYNYFIIGAALGIPLLFISIPYGISLIPLALMSGIGLYKEYKIDSEIEKLSNQLSLTENEKNNENTTNSNQPSITYTLGNKIISAQEINQTLNNTQQNIKVKSTETIKTYEKK